MSGWYGPLILSFQERPPLNAQIIVGHRQNGEMFTHPAVVVRETTRAEYEACRKERGISDPIIYSYYYEIMTD